MNANKIVKDAVKKMPELKNPECKIEPTDMLGIYAYAYFSAGSESPMEEINFSPSALSKIFRRVSSSIAEDIMVKRLDGEKAHDNAAKKLAAYLILFVCHHNSDASLITKSQSAGRFDFIVKTQNGERNFLELCRKCVLLDARKGSVGFDGEKIAEAIKQDCGIDMPPIEKV
ncbi:MAG: hypothetical protein ACI4QV_02215 [Acutalibacteraceae bacterium]